MSRISVLALWSRRDVTVALLVAATCAGVAAAGPAAAQAQATEPPSSPSSAHGPTRATLPPRASAASRADLPGAAIAQSPIQHVVVIYLENHTFDNVLGYWCHSHPARCPDGGMPASVTLSDGTVVKPTVTPDLIPVVNHSVAAQVAAMNIKNGVPQMNGWQNIPTAGAQLGCGAAQHYDCISGYQPTQVPNLTSLAKIFAISDMTFSMADSPSWGGHLYAAMGSLDGFTGDNPVPAKGVTPGPGWGCESDLVTPWLGPYGGTYLVPSCIPDYSLDPVQHPNGGAFEPTPAAYHGTIFDELSAAGLSWRIYGAATPPAAGATNNGWTWSICPSLAECLDTSQRSNLVDASQFYTNAAAGTLPNYSIVTAGGSGSYISDGCHNAESMTACDDYIGSLVNAVEKGPDWSSTAVFITFDDFGGFYDQVPPRINPDYTQQGPRVPLIIVSPYAKARYTDTTATTFAGILAYTEQNFGLAPLGPNDKWAYPFTNAFNYSQTPLNPVRMVHRPLPASAQHIRLTPALENDPS
jgi:phospholipase C